MCFESEWVIFCIKEPLEALRWRDVRSRTVRQDGREDGKTGENKQCEDVELGGISSEMFRLNQGTVSESRMGQRSAMYSFRLLIVNHSFLADFDWYYPTFICVEAI